MSAAPIDPKNQWPSAALGQLGGLGLGLGLLQLTAGPAWTGLLHRPEPFLFVALGTWALAAGVACWGIARRAGAAPLWPVLVGLAPLVAGFLLAAMTSANRQMLAAGGCGLWLSLSASAERLRVLGLLGSAAVWWGCLPGLLRLPGPGEIRRPVWGLPAIGVLLAGSLVWALVDPLAPATAAVGGPAVRGLWPVALGVPVAWLGWQGSSADARGPAAERGLALAAAAWLGLLAALFGTWLLARADALRLLVAPAGPAPAWPAWYAAGQSLAAAAWPLAITAAAGLGLAGWLVGPRSGRRRALGLLVGLGVMIVLAVAHEGAFSQRFAAQCLPQAEVGGCDPERRLLGACLSRARPEQMPSANPD